MAGVGELTGGFRCSSKSCSVSCPLRWVSSATCRISCWTSFAYRVWSALKGTSADESGAIGNS